MNMKILNISACIMAFAGACSMQASSDGSMDKVEKNGEPIRYTLGEIMPRIQGLDGQIITVRGYITGYGPTMILMKDATSDPLEKPTPERPAITVADDNLGFDVLSRAQPMELGSYFNSLGCLDRYVDIVGEVGLMRGGDNHGIIRIVTIATFEDGSFSGEGQICYSSDTG